MNLEMSKKVFQIKGIQRTGVLGRNEHDCYSTVSGSLGSNSGSAAVLIPASSSCMTWDQKMMMPRVIGSLPHSREVWTEFWVPGFSLAVMGIWRVKLQMETLFFYICFS